MLSMATSNYLNGMLGKLGLRILLYYNVGPLSVCLIYFLAKQMGCFEPNLKRSSARQTGIPSLLNIPRSLLRNDDDEIDLKMIGFIILAAFLQCAITILLNRTFYLCTLANLNIGLAQSVIASMAFFVALFDYCLFK